MKVRTNSDVDMFVFICKFPDSLFRKSFGSHICDESRSGKGLFFRYRIPILIERRQIRMAYRTIEL